MKQIRHTVAEPRSGQGMRYERIDGRMTDARTDGVKPIYPSPPPPPPTTSLCEGTIMTQFTDARIHHWVRVC